MIYRVYPMILGGTNALLTVVGFASVMAATSYRWPLVLVPFLAAFGRLLTVGLLEPHFPRIRFVNDAEINGHGYVHQPLDSILPVFLGGLLTAIALLVRG